jgi:hypothetical protein
MVEARNTEPTTPDHSEQAGIRRLTQKSAGVLSQVRNLMGKPAFWHLCNAVSTAVITTAALKLDGKIRASKQPAMLAGAGAVASDGVLAASSTIVPSSITEGTSVTSAIQEAAFAVRDMATSIRELVVHWHDATTADQRPAGWSPSSNLLGQARNFGVQSGPVGEPARTAQDYADAAQESAVTAQMAADQAWNVARGAGNAQPPARPIMTQAAS